jgi:hypothetical protein
MLNTRARKTLDENGLPVVLLKGEGCTFRLHMSITVFEILGDDENYLVRQPVSGEVTIAPKNIVNRDYARWDGKW